VSSWAYPALCVLVGGQLAKEEADVAILRSTPDSKIGVIALLPLDDIRSQRKLSNLKN
jgi:hypothetical protein